MLEKGLWTLSDEGSNWSIRCCVTKGSNLKLMRNPLVLQRNVSKEMNKSAEVNTYIPFLLLALLGTIFVKICRNAVPSTNLILSARR